MEYEYIEKETNEDININSVLQTVTPKYYREEKEILDQEDITNKPEIIITESRMNKNDYKCDNVMTISFALACFITLSFISINEITNQVVGLNEDISLKELKEQLKNTKITIKKIKEEYIKIGNKVVKLQEEYQNKPNDLTEEISPELLDVVKKYVK